MQKVWAKKNLFLFYLPPYSPQLNSIERLWKELKERWIQTAHYQTADTLFYQTKLILNEIGNSLMMNFKNIVRLIVHDYLGSFNFTMAMQNQWQNTAYEIIRSIKEN